MFSQHRTVLGRENMVYRNNPHAVSDHASITKRVPDSAGLAFISLGLLTLSACSAVPLEPIDTDHPAHPEALAAPVAKAPDTLRVDAVDAPPQDEDPHAGHNMNMGHEM